MLPSVAVYLAQTNWLLSEFDRNLHAVTPAILGYRPGISTTTNSPLVIANHAAAVTRAYALGIGCGVDVTRDRAVEFLDSGVDLKTVSGQLTHLTAQLDKHFPALTDARLDAPLVPAKSLYGEGDPREMTPREAIVENIRHLGIHLGEMRLTISLLSE